MRRQDMWYQLLYMQLKPGSLTKPRRRRARSKESYQFDPKQLGTELQEEAWKTQFTSSLLIYRTTRSTSLAFLLGNYNVNIPITKNPNCDDQPDTRQFELININQTRTKKADENFWRRSS